MINRFHLTPVLLCVLVAVPALCSEGCGGGSRSDTPEVDQAGSIEGRQSESGPVDEEATAAEKEQEGTRGSEASSGSCEPHYIEGKTGEEVAESISSLYNCIIERGVVGSEAQLDEYANYILGPQEVAANQYLLLGGSAGVWPAMQSLYSENPNANVHFSVTCQSLGANESALTIALGETQINEGFNDSAFNGEATEYSRYYLIPTTPSVAGFSAGGNEEIWTIKLEQPLGEAGETYPEEGSCERPLEWAGPQKPSQGDDGLPSLEGL
jgi:hypothetical protein